MTVRIYDKSLRLVSTSKNLRGIIDYSRVHAVDRVDLYGPNPDGSGHIGVTWVNGSSTTADFNSYAVMLQWVVNRQCFKGDDVYIWLQTKGEPKRRLIRVACKRDELFFPDFLANDGRIVVWDQTSGHGEAAMVYYRNRPNSSADHGALLMRRYSNAYSSIGDDPFTLYRINKAKA